MDASTASASALAAQYSSVQGRLQYALQEAHSWQVATTLAQQSERRVREELVGKVQHWQQQARSQRVAKKKVEAALKDLKERQRLKSASQVPEPSAAAAAAAAAAPELVKQEQQSTQALYMRLTMLRTTCRTLEGLLVPLLTPGEKRGLPSENLLQPQQQQPQQLQQLQQQQPQQQLQELQQPKRGQQAQQEGATVATSLVAKEGKVKGAAVPHPLPPVAGSASRFQLICGLTVLCAAFVFSGVVGLWWGTP
jgi:hypothetical protein